MILLTALLVAGCAKKGGLEKPAPTSEPIPEPVPPPGSARGLSLPEADGEGRFRTINSGLDAQEATWHLRAAFNVAALSCPGDPAIAKGYNRLLADRKAVFASAYKSEARKAAAALDRHMTQLYNFFAQPPAQAAFCRAAGAEVGRATAEAAVGFPAYAVDALGRLEKPITDFYRAYAAYSQDLAAWKAAPNRSRKAEVPEQQLAVAAAPAGAWRIQIGAFTGKPAAEAAWEQAKKRVSSMADYKPHYEEVPGRVGVIRLQMGDARSREEALKLCATAAVGGFDCLPVPRSKG